MTTRFVQQGEVMDYVNGGSAVASGAVLVIGVRVGVALADIAANATGSVAMEGVFTVAKVSGTAFAQGVALYWDATNSRTTTTASGNTLAGYAFTSAASGATEVNLKLNA